MQKGIFGLLIGGFLLFSLGTAMGSDPVPAPRPNRALMDKAFRKGVIDREAYLVQQLKSYFSPQHVDGSFLSVAKRVNPRPSRELTHLLLEARKNYYTYGAETRSFLDQVFKRPDDKNYVDYDGDGNEINFFLPAPVESFVPDAATYPNIGNKFKFWYVTHSIPDSGGNTHTTTLEFVKKMAGVLETTIKKIVTDMGYPDPPSDGGMPSDENGGDELYDIYIMDTGLNGAYGAVVTEDYSDGGNSYLSYMMMDNDYSATQFPSQDYSDPVLSPMQVTMAHELHHSIQISINAEVGRWFMESTSTWIEDQVWDDVDDNRQYLPGFFTTPNTSLDSDEEDYFYGVWIFNEFLELKYGNGTILNIWQALDPVGKNDVVVAISDTLKKSTATFKDALTLFRAKNYSKIPFYTDAQSAPEAYVNIKIENSLTPYVLDAGNISLPEKTTSIHHLACKYYVFKPNVSNLTQLNLKLQVDGTDNKEISAVAIAKKADGTYTEYPFTLDNTTVDGSETIADFTSLSEVILCLVNYSKSAGDDNTEVKFKASVAESLDDDNSGDTGNGTDDNDNDTDTSDNNDESSSGGCFLKVMM